MDRSGKLKSTNDPLILEFITDENYQIYSNGIILSRINEQGHCGTWREVGSEKKGYRRVHYQGKHLPVHRIIWAKYGNTPLADDLVINHLDGKRNNNHIDNLELTTQSINNIHRFRVLKHPGVKGNVVLGWDVVRAIRADRTAGFTYKQIMEKHGLTSKGQISEIVNYKVWVE